MKRTHFIKIVFALMLSLSCVFSVFALPASAATRFSLSATSMTIRDGEKAVLTINGAKSNTKWTYEVSNPNVISTSKSGNKLYILGLHNTENDFAPSLGDAFSTAISDTKVPEDATDATKVIWGSVKAVNAANTAANRAKQNSTAIQANSTTITINVDGQKLSCKVSVMQELRKSDFNYAGDSATARTDEYGYTNYIDRVNETNKEYSINAKDDDLTLEPRGYGIGNSIRKIKNVFGNKKAEDVTTDDDSQFVDDVDIFWGKYRTKLTYSYYDNSYKEMFYITFYFDGHGTCNNIVYHCEGIA
ncbi:MAG: hypothetical protein ACI4CC_04820 [Lachnospiraceae bacterium]